MILKPIYEFFKKKKLTPFPFQEAAWEAILRGDSGLIHVPTGSGKTYAVIMPVFAELMASPKKGLRVLYITPLRALARDLETALLAPVESEKWPLKIESRTGDTKGTLKKKQLTHPADLLLTTPESLAQLIANSNAEEYLASVEIVIVDEWHELLSSKRGSLLELGLAFLRNLNPDLRIWGLSATIGNLEEAAQVLVGRTLTPTLISSEIERKLDVECLLPDELDRFPWAGHLGFSMRQKLLENLDRDTSTLIFTNTRNQAERWYKTFVESCPEMQERMALHHGSLDREEREWVEDGVKNGSLKWIFCTSSLDLGVDFQPVERVVQIGSPKMVARMLQRAGRSAHRPGGMSRLLFVPTNAWEILELEALKRSLVEKKFEARRPLVKPIDVLIQHMATLACGPGLDLEQLFFSLKDTYSFHDLTREELTWCLKFLTQGGDVLHRYPQYHKLVYQTDSGRYTIPDKRLSLFHRLSIGTIVSRESVSVAFTKGSRIGTLDESFIAKLKKGDVFQFGGRRLQFVMLKDMTAYVKLSKAATNVVPSWDGNRLPLSEVLSESFREELYRRHPDLDDLLSPILKAQERLSRIPGPQDFLIETWSSREGEHLLAYPFDGRLVHEGIAQLWALRFAQRERATFSFSVNDYGFELLGHRGYPFEKLFDDEFFRHDRLLEETQESLHMSEMSRRQFREIAQIAGLVFTGYPGSQKTGKQRQISAALLFDVFTKFDPNNLLLKQSRDEVLHSSLEYSRLERTLDRLGKMRQRWNRLKGPSPLAVPLIIERVASRLSNETLEDKVARLKKTWEKVP